MSIRIMKMIPPEDGDCPTCGNCGEDFVEGRYYDNDVFQYLCKECAGAIDPDIHRCGYDQERT